MTKSPPEREREPYPYETATPEQCEPGYPWWCVHHARHVEWLVEPIASRVQYISEYKAPPEVPIRLRNLAPVKHPDRLPSAVREAGRAYYEACRAYYEACRAYPEACRAYPEAGRAYREAYLAHYEAYRAHREAGRAYREACRAHREAGRAYREACRAYREACRAHREAGRAYREACRAYNEACWAYNEACRTHESELMVLHREEYPDTTWNGESIFDDER